MDIKKLSVGKNAPEEVNVFIEITAQIRARFVMMEEQTIWKHLKKCDLW